MITSFIPVAAVKLFGRRHSIVALAILITIKRFDMTLINGFYFLYALKLIVQIDTHCCFCFNDNFVMTKRKKFKAKMKIWVFVRLSYRQYKKYFSENRDTLLKFKSSYILQLYRKLFWIYLWNAYIYLKLRLKKQQLKKFSPKKNKLSPLHILLNCH